jgi:hypothetical protein
VISILTRPLPFKDADRQNWLLPIYEYLATRPPTQSLDQHPYALHVATGRSPGRRWSGRTGPLLRRWRRERGKSSADPKGHGRAANAKVTSEWAVMRPVVPRQLPELDFWTASLGFTCTDRAFIWPIMMPARLHIITVIIALLIVMLGGIAWLVRPTASPPPILAQRDMRASCRCWWAPLPAKVFSIT